MSRLIVLSTGGLGNQLFHAALAHRISCTADGPVELLGAAQLDRFADLSISRLHVHSNLLSNGVYRLLRSQRLRVLSVLERTRQIPVVMPDELSSRHGTKLLTIVDTAAATLPDQALVAESFLSHMVIRDPWQHEAEHTRNTIGNGPIAFVHVRLGDFKVWPERHYPAVLPWSFYEVAMDRLEGQHPGISFALLSDDLDLAFRNLRHGRNLIPISLSAEASLAFAKLCVAGVLSASTFSWWLAQFSQGTPDQLLAPLFWAGHSRARWFPLCRPPGHFEYLPVNLDP